MAGQVSIGPNTFEITELQVVETGSGALNNIVDQGEEFRLRARIEGSGPDWDSYEGLGCTVGARFYADGMGPDVTDHDWGTMFEPMEDDFWIYTDEVSVDDEHGIYRCGVVANLYNSDGTFAIKGYVAYNEECPLQVNPHEE